MPGNAPQSAALFLLPHHDDEFFMLGPIRERLAEGRRVVVAYLTFGSIYGASSEQRVAESDGVLKGCGVSTEDVHQLGVEQDIFDGRLHTRLTDAFRTVERLLPRYSFTEICVLAWEGGHQDHDSAHYLGAMLGRLRLPQAELREFPAYTAYRRPAPLFSVMRLIPGRGPIDRSPVPFMERFRILRTAMVYRSQRRTFVGLMPGILTRLFLRGGLESRRVAGIDYHTRPHTGALYYERRFGVSFSDLCKAMDSFEAAVTA